MAARNQPSAGGKPDKLIRDALMVAINRETKVNGKKTKRLYVLTDKLVEAACDGDLGAIKEIADRIDGRPTQAMQHGGNLVMEHIERILVSSKDTDG